MTLELVALGAAAVAVSRPDRRARGLGLLAVLALGLGAASIHVVLGGTAPLRALGAVAGPDAAFLQAAAALLLLGAGLALAAGPWPLGALVAAATAWASWPLPRLPGMPRAVGIAAGIVAVGVAAWLLLDWLRPGRLLLALDRVVAPGGGRHDDRSPAPPRSGAGLAAMMAGGLAVLVPHLATVLGGTTVALGALATARGRDGRRPWILLPAALLSFLALVWSVRLAGPLGGWLPTLVDGPFSPRAALLLGAMISAAAWMAAAAWPLHGAAVPRAAALLVIPLVAVYGGLLIPDGLRHWQPLLAPLTLLGMMHAAAAARLDRLLLQGGLLGLWTATAPGAMGGGVLVACAVVVAGRRTPLPGALRVLALVPAAGGVLVLRGHLHTEVVYGLVAAAVAALAIGRTMVAAGAPPLRAGDAVARPG